MRIGTIVVAAVCLLGAPPARPAEEQLLDLSRLEITNGVAEKTTYHGQSALKMVQKDLAIEEAHVMLKGVQFRNGTIELDVSGAPSKTADPTARGFIGVLFHILPGRAGSEVIYLRPTNGRSEDQALRNHATQYASDPDWGWQRLRAEFPFVYESYADMQPGEWTHMRIVVHGKDARLWVGSAEQPCLIVHDLKHGETEGAVALWIGPGTEGYFRNLTITPDAR